MYHRSLLVGMLLGDGCIKLKHHVCDTGKKSTYAEYVIAHSWRQLEYLQHKAKLLHSIIGGKELKLHKEHTTLSNGVTYSSYRIGRCHKYFRLLHRWAYLNNGKKYFSRAILDKLTPEGIAYWYMDDGGVKKSKWNGKVTSVLCTLATYCSKDEVDTIIQYFLDEYGIKWKALYHKQSNSWYLCCNTTESRKLERLIHKYIIPSMKYKLPGSYITRQQGTYNKGEEIVSST